MTTDDSQAHGGDAAERLRQHLQQRFGPEGDETDYGSGDHDEEQADRDDEQADLPEEPDHDADGVNHDDAAVNGNLELQDERAEPGMGSAE